MTIFIYKTDSICIQENLFINKNSLKFYSVNSTFYKFTNKACSHILFKTFHWNILIKKNYIYTNLVPLSLINNKII